MAGAGEPPPRPVPRPGLSWAEAGSRRGKLEAIEKQRVVVPPRNSRLPTVTVTESELIAI
jgi:hypothetical protein